MLQGSWGTHLHAADASSDRDVARSRILDACNKVDTLTEFPEQQIGTSFGSPMLPY